MTRASSGECSQCGGFVPFERKHNYCHSCLNIYRAKWRAQNLVRDRATQRRWNDRHPEVIRAANERQMMKKKQAQS